MGYIIVSERIGLWALRAMCPSTWDVASSVPFPRKILDELDTRGYNKTEER